MSSLRSTSLSVMRPPKPPCWRDFVVPSPKSINSEGVDTPDPAGRALGARSPIADLVDSSRSAASVPGNKPSRLARRPRARIHRTRSEHVIHAEDLPESAFTTTLADTDPKGMRTRTPDGRLYVEENNRRCQNWLASIEAAEPLDEVTYNVEKKTLSTSVSNDFVQTSDTISGDPNNVHFREPGNELIPIDELEQGVDVEIPEETFVWDVSRLNSPSVEEETCNACQLIANRSDGKKFSGTISCSHKYSNVSHRIDLEISDTEHKQTNESAKAEINCAASSSKTVQSGKKSVSKKLHKLCCDSEEKMDKSFSQRQIDGRHAVGSGEGEKGQSMKGLGDAIVTSTSKSSSSKPRRVRSSTRRSSSQRWLIEAEIEALNQSTSD